MHPDLPELIIAGLRRADTNIVVGLWDSLLHDVYMAVDADPSIRYIPVTNEAEGLCVAAGAWSAGKRAVMLMENSGLRSGCEALVRLGIQQGIPVPLIMGYRGDLGERAEYARNHGMTMEPLLKLLNIPYWIVDDAEMVADAVERTIVHATASLYHSAVVFRAPLVD